MLFSSKTSQALIYCLLTNMSTTWKQRHGATKFEEMTISFSPLGCKGLKMVHTYTNTVLILEKQTGINTYSDWPTQDSLQAFYSKASGTWAHLVWAQCLPAQGGPHFSHNQAQLWDWELRHKNTSIIINYNWAIQVSL